MARHRNDECDPQEPNGSTARGQRIGGQILSALRFLERIAKNAPVIELLVRNPSIDCGVIARFTSIRRYISALAVKTGSLDGWRFES